VAILELDVGGVLSTARTADGVLDLDSEQLEDAPKSILVSSSNSKSVIETQ
jgi:hypothetical protein